jgi:hypothetical protein
MSEAEEATACLLETGCQRPGLCLGESCPFWDGSTARCLFHPIAGEFAARPQLASSALELRRSLQAAREGIDSHDQAFFFHRLNLENLHDGGAS